MLARTTAEAYISVAETFDAVAESYDDTFTDSAIGRAQRQSVWRIIDRTFRPGQRILEINCGTGVDAKHMAEQGIRVLACDASSGMINEARRRMEVSKGRDLVDLKALATEKIHHLAGEDLFDGVLSNFAGLNCAADLKSVARDLAPLVCRGGRAILCLFGRACIWEILWYAARIDLPRAFRRLRPGGCLASIAPGRRVQVRYPSVRSLRQDFLPYFRLLGWEGVGVAVPPSYLDGLAAQFPRALRWAARVDPLLGRVPLLRAMADHLVLTLERSAE